MRARWSFLMFVGVLAGNVDATVFHAPMYALFDLKPAEAKLFENIACMDRYAVGIERAQGSVSDTDTLADARAVYAVCKSHRKIDGQPVVYEVECKREDVASEWKCESGEETMLARIDRILVRITLRCDTATIDQAYWALKNLRVTHPQEKLAVDEPQPPATEGTADCWVYNPPGGETMLNCNGAGPFPLATLRAEP